MMLHRLAQSARGLFPGAVVAWAGLLVLAVLTARGRPEPLATVFAAGT